MPVETKAQIKSYFQTGDVPTQSQFANLIDSYQDAPLLDVGAVLADTATYSNGTVVRTAREGYTYVADTTGPIVNAGGQHLTPAGSIISPRMFGARGDANEDASTESAVGTNDAAAVLAALRHAESIGGKLLLDGKFRVHSAEITVRKPVSIEGLGAGGGYGGAGALTGYDMVSGLVFTGTGTQRIRTRVLHRASAADPQDAPLSVCLNIQAEFTTLRDFAVYLWFNRGDASPTNFGSNCDVGVFTGTRVHVKLYGVHIVGYWRECGYWSDCTRGSNLPQFSDPLGVAYEEGTVKHGADGLTMVDVYIRGAKWGIRVQGAKPEVGQTTLVNYYDQILGASTTDFRGTFGHSDFTMIGCSIYGTDHHSLRRRANPTMNYLTDTTAGGAIWIDGLCPGNGSDVLHGMRFVSSRFATFEAFHVRLGNAARVEMIGCHIETRASASHLSSSGGALVFDSTDTYGLVTMEDRSRNILMIGMQSGSLLNSGFDTFIHANATYHDLFSGIGASTSRTTHSIVAGGFRALTDAMDLRTAGASKDYNFRDASAVTLATLSGDRGLSFQAAMASPIVEALSGELDLRSASGSPIRFRRGTTTAALLDANGTSTTSVFSVITREKGDARYAAAGTTGSRPSLAAGDAGRMFLDTTLGRPVWWTGSAWVDATGSSA